MEPGVFGAARMRESRARVRVTGWCVQVGLGAGAVASSRRYMTQQGRCIGKERERADQDSYPRAQCSQK